MMCAMKSKKPDILVLNRAWIPIQIVDWQRAMLHLIKETIHPLDRDLNTYDLQTWLEYSRLHDTDYPVVTTVRYKIALPEIVILKEFDRLPMRDVKYSRQTLFERDNFLCCYCHKKFVKTDLTVDHVLPRCQGGKTVWENTVTACKPCNNWKDNRTPQQAGMKMHFHPKKPKWISPLTKVGKEHPCKSWLKFLHKTLVD